MATNNRNGLVETNNGALAHASSGSEVLNVFGLAGAMRNANEKEINTLIHKAWQDDRDLALRVFFYLGDIRGGQGERRFLKQAINYLIKNDPKIAEKIISLIPEYSRWDLVYEFEGTALEKEMFQEISKQFKDDMNSLSKGESVSLLGKWLKSINTDSDESRRLGRKTAEALGLTIPKYRKSLSKLRAVIDVVEKKMCAKDWEEIDFNKVPGHAFKKYRHAWTKHVPEKLEGYIKRVETGEIKMKSSVLYPYHIVQNSYSAKTDAEIKTAELQWRDLPNYLEGTTDFIIPVIDTSGSMTSLIGDGSLTAILVAKSIGLYVSERLSGPFKDHYITFSNRPILGKFTGNTLAQKIENMQSIVENTNIEAVFDIILRTALTNQTPANEMPTKILILSDMEFDSCVSMNSTQTSGWYGSGAASKSQLKTLFQTMKSKFEQAGYELPDIVFWNLNSDGKKFPVSQHETGAALVSGFSPSVLKSVLSGKGLTPMEIMMAVLDNPRYAALSELFKEEEDGEDEK
jgi:hypothetical protein